MSEPVMMVPIAALGEKQQEIFDLQERIAGLEAEIQRIIAPAEVGGGIIEHLRHRIAELEAEVASYRELLHAVEKGENADRFLTHDEVFGPSEQDEADRRLGALVRRMRGDMLLGMREEPYFGPDGETEYRERWRIVSQAEAIILWDTPEDALLETLGEPCD